MPRYFSSVILFAAFALISVAGMGDLLAEPPVLPRGDGAPGEGEEPGFFIELPAEPGQNFAQAPPATELPNDDDRAEKTKNKDKQKPLDDLDRRAAVRKDRQSLWKKTAEKAASAEWNDFLKSLDEWHDQSMGGAGEDSFVRLPDGTLRSGRLEAARLLLRLPEEQRRSREQQTGARARTILDRAMTSGGLAELGHTASRFFGTQAGYAAANQLATRLLDSGEYALAAQWMLLLNEAGAPSTRNPTWQRRLQLVLSITGQHDRDAGHEPADTGDHDPNVNAVSSGLIDPQAAAVNDWLLPGGNAARHARTPGGKPVLFPRWSVSVISSHRLRDSVDTMFDDIAEQHESTVPAAAPICVDGKLISRTVRGIEVIDVETGRRLWTSAERSSVERILENASGKQTKKLEARSFAWQLGGFDSLEAPVIANGPLSQFLFQNAAQGLLSSDGRLVFSVEDDPILTLGRTSIRDSSGIDEGPEPGSATSNRLTATSLATGRIAWQIGGPNSGDVPGNALAGLFFMGAPVPAGDDLFVVAMKERDVTLYCLDPTTGAARWSQLLAFADHTPDRDLVRRIWSAQPAVAHGVVVCPTTVGWLVAVDRSTGTLLWSHRYSTRKRKLLTPDFDPFGDGGLTSMASESINSRWVTTPPVIAGRRVYVTPAESKHADDPSSGLILCLDLFTGRRIWQKPRGQGRYLAGVVNQRAVVVENAAVVAYGSTGKPVWDLELPRSAGAPSGRGVIADNTLWQPTLNRSLLRIDLNGGKIAERLTLPETSRPLGNLVMYRGKLISQHPAEITAFEQAAVLKQRLAAASDETRDPQTALLAARLALSNGEARRAISVLKTILSTSPASDLREQFQTLLAQAILTNLEEAPEASLTLVRELDTLPGSPAVSTKHQRLAIEVLLQTGHADEALSRLIPLEAAPSETVVPLLDNPKLRVSHFNWLRTRLDTAWSKLSSSQRPAFLGQIAKLLSTADIPEDVQTRRARLFAFHPAVTALQQSLAQRALKDGRYAQADFWLNRLAASSNADTAADALLRRAELHIEHFVDASDLTDLFDQAEHMAGRAEDTAAFVNRIDRLRDELKARASESGPSGESRWQIGARPVVSLARTGGTHSRANTFSLETLQEEPPAGSRYRVEIRSDGNTRRLLLKERHSDELAWSVMLRGGQGNSRLIGLRRTESLLLVLNGSALHCLSIPERRTLWTRTIELPDTPPGRFPKIKAVQLQPGAEWMQQTTGSNNDPLPVVTPRIVCCRGQKSLTVIDTLTGEALWRLDPAPRTPRVIQRDALLCLVRRSGEVMAAYDAISGRPVPDPPGKRASPLARFADRSVVAMLDEAGDMITIRSQRETADTADWSHDFESDFSLGMVGRHSLAVMRNRGHFAVLDLRSGGLREFERIPASLRIGKSDFRVFRDERRWYVALNGSTNPTHRAPSVKNLLVAGHVLAFDAPTGQLLWKRSLSDEFLVTEHFTSNPVLLVLSPTHNPLGVPSERLDLQVLSKTTGETLLDRKLPGIISLRSMRLNRPGRMIELFAPNNRIRLTLQAETPR